MANLPPWNFTLLNDFANCAFKALHKHILKDLPKEPMSKEMSEGIRVHTELEQAAKSGARTPSYVMYEKLVDPIFYNKPQAEVMLGMTDEITPSPFFGSPWGRGKVDILIKRESVAIIFDWKTGKVREDPRELHQHALLIKANFPEVEKITGAYVWLKESRLGEVYDLSNTDRVFNGTKANMAEMQTCLDKGRWEPTPNPLCGWCPVKKCQFNRS